MTGTTLGVTIHPSAVVDPAAVLGRGVQIGPFCTVGPDVVLEDGVRLISHAVVDGHTQIGRDAILYPFCTVGLAPQDMKYQGEPTTCHIGARTVIREHCTIHRGTSTGNGVTAIGDDCMLMAVVHVAHDCTIGNHVIIANNAMMGGHVVIGDHAVLGGGAAIHQFVRIGRAAMIGGISGAAADVIPFGSVLGNRGKLAGLNVVGLKRRGFDKDAIANLRVAYGTLFRHEGVFAERVEETRAKYGEDPLVAEILAFIDGESHRGLIQWE
ncbi:MAG: acyl-ACP--UDP-N-acetylglucosamine O-acyltransferase [Acetobacteraceae bacterium]|nr:acyl-ACP--UDP-N-acetylglucosamine O-acyltransferase [Acetobacteraceae bacterium]